MNINCNTGGIEGNACNEAQFYCPTQSENCNIDCITTKSCNNTQIYNINEVYSDQTKAIRRRRLMSVLCTADEECIVDCETEQECKDIIIDASLATNLTLNCMATQACYNTTVMCPDGICDVTCDGSFEACYEQKIYYFGEIQDRGGVLLNCKTMEAMPYINGTTTCVSDYNDHCYHADVYTSTDTETSTTVSVQNIDQTIFVFYHVEFTIQNYECMNPKLTFQYELVK